MEEVMMTMTLHKYEQAKKITFAANQACNACDFVQPAAALEVDLGASFLTREVDLLGSFLSSRG